MLVKNSKKEEWEKIINRYQQSPKKRKELRFIMQWVTLMEFEIDRDIDISTCARKTLSITSTQIPGSGCNLVTWVDILEDIWEYGKELKEWYYDKDSKIVYYNEAYVFDSKTTNIHVSKHASKRLHERCGLGKKAGRKMATRALEKGIKKEETQGSLRAYMGQIEGNTEEGAIVRLFGENIYVYKEQANGYLLITVMYLPHKYKKNKNQEILTMAN